MNAFKFGAIVSAIDRLTQAIKKIVISSVPTGGTTGQVLTKVSNANYDLEWSTPSVGSSLIFSKLKRSTNQSVPNAVWTKIDTDVSEMTVGDITNDTVNKKIIINQPGYYRYIIYCSFEANTTGRRVVGVGKNGSVVEDFYVGMDSFGGYRVAHMGFLNLVATDYITLHAYQNSGANRNVNGWVVLERISS